METSGHQFDFERARYHYDRLRSRPGWVLKTAFVAAMLVIVLPLVVLALAAAVTFAVLLVVLGAVAAVIGGVRSFFGGIGDMFSDDGRRNVRVRRVTR